MSFKTYAEIGKGWQTRGFNSDATVQQLIDSKKLGGDDVLIALFMSLTTEVTKLREQLSASASYGIAEAHVYSAVISRKCRTILYDKLPRKLLKKLEKHGFACPYVVAMQGMKGLKKLRLKKDELDSLQTWLDLYGLTLVPSQPKAVEPEAVIVPMNAEQS